MAAFFALAWDQPASRLVRMPGEKRVAFFGSYLYSGESRLVGRSGEHRNPTSRAVGLQQEVSLRG